MRQLFTFGKPVKGSELIDRKNDVSAIVRDLSGGQSIAFASPRRLGKSSIIMEALRKLKKKGSLTAYIDLFEVSSVRGFSEKIIEAVLENETSRIKLAFKSLKENLSNFLRQTRFKYLWKEHEFILSFGDPAAKEDKLLEEALDFPEQFAKKRKKKIIVAIDEFGELVNWNGNLLKKMRAKFQKQDRTAYIFSGSQESLIRKLFKDKAQAFYGFSKVIGLGFLPETDFIRYIIRTFRKGGMKINWEVAERLVLMMQSHPHYTKLLAQSIYDVMAGRKKSVTELELKRGFEKAFMYVKDELDKEWTQLSKAPLQKEVLKYLAIGKGTLYSKGSFANVPKTSIYLALKEIEEKGIIKKTGKGKYLFINPFFKEYLKRMEENKL